MSLYEEKGLAMDPSKRALTFASLAEKSPVAPLSKGHRSVRTLPFSEKVFRLIAERFYVHHSISAIVSRADIPSFSVAEVEMKDAEGSTHFAEGTRRHILNTLLSHIDQNGVVYNCRTSNAWEMDMALTATHFPHRGLTFAIIFGCPLSIEAEVIQRLSKAGRGSSHPLVLPGIFAEMERSRHIAVVEKMIDQLESRIYELDFEGSGTSSWGAKEREQIHRDKREDFLDTSYLKNGLISWRNQLHKMAKYGNNFDLQKTQERNHVATPQESRNLSNELSMQNRDTSQYGAPKMSEKSHQLHKTNRKILDRLEHIIEEYDDKIRDCTMRLDGMAMATQWVSPEEIISTSVKNAFGSELNVNRHKGKRM